MALCPTLSRNDFLSRVTKPRLLQEKDLLFDYDNLRACLDPTNEINDDEPAEKAESKEFYWDFLISLNSWEFTQLEALSLRNLHTSKHLELTKRMLSNVFQYDTLQKLDLSNNSLAEVEDLLQFWYLTNLKSLFLDATGITSLPPSIGRLKKLEELSVKNNKLTTLPEILRFCTELRVLNLVNNKFIRIPGVVLQLKKLEDLWKYYNTLKTTVSHNATATGEEMAYHIGVVPRNPKAPTTNTNTTPQNTTGSDNKNKPSVVYNPQLLQTLSCKVLAQHSVPYWTVPYLPPLLCKNLDLIHTEYNLCENCHTTVPKDTGYVVEVMLVDFLGLKEVAFELVVCSMECSIPVRAAMVQKQKETREKLERDYEEMIEVHRKECEEHEQTVLRTLAANRPKRNRRRNQNRRACVIM